MSSKQSESGEIARDASTNGGVLGDAVAQLDLELATFEMVEARLIEAWGYLLRMPDREKGWQRIKAMWPDMRRHTAFGDYGDMDPDAKPRKPGLRTAEVDQMEEALGWVEWVPVQHRTLIGVVLSQLQRVSRPEWIAAAERLRDGSTPEACRKRYSRSITLICERLSRRNPKVEAVKG